MPSQSPPQDWYIANHRYLMGLLAQTRRLLEQHIDHNPQDTPPLGTEDCGAHDADRWVDQPTFQASPPALERLCQVFGLSPFEREIILLCAGMEFDPSWGRLCAAAQGQLQWDYPTFSLALSIASSAYWGALMPNAPLRRWRLIEIGAGNALTHSILRLDESITHYLAGLHPVDERLARSGLSGLPQEPLVESHQTLAEQMARAWAQASQENRELPILQLCGSDASSKRAIAATICHVLGIHGYVMAIQALPSENHSLHEMGCLWEREWRLHQRVMVLDCDRLLSPDDDKDHRLTQLLALLPGPLIITSPERRPLSQRATLAVDVQPPSSGEQRQMWQVALGDDLARSLDGQIDRLVAHFTLNPATIAATSLQFKALQLNLPTRDLAGVGAESAVALEQSCRVLWDACRTQARPRLDELAQRIEATATWDDLVLPEPELAVLQAIAVHVRQRSKVYEQWGFVTKGTRGLGINALFAGASGTGKTLAAEVLANALHLDIYRIDLSAVVSKYIGETEKNLRRVFDAAEGGGVVLLFDEADALFGKRTEVKDSHDRHANIEVSYLLQRMEAYRGLAILTTNLKASLDQAFLRRLRFVVQFPFPTANQRANIWQRIFPAQTPTAPLDFSKLAKLNVTGGNIRNIALNAAFLAAEADEPVGMHHILQAARSEAMKLERPLTDAEIRGWV